MNPERSPADLAALQAAIIERILTMPARFRTTYRPKLPISPADRRRLQAAEARRERRRGSRMPATAPAGPTGRDSRA